MWGVLTLAAGWRGRLWAQVWWQGAVNGRPPLEPPGAREVPELEKPSPLCPQLHPRPADPQFGTGSLCLSEADTYHLTSDPVTGQSWERQSMCALNQTSPVRMAHRGPHRVLLSSLILPIASSC